MAKHSKSNAHSPVWDVVYIKKKIVNKTVSKL
jgi:ribosomal protein L39E